MAEPLPQQPEHQASYAERVRQIRNYTETSYQLKATELICLDSDLQIFKRFNELRMFVILRHQHRLAALTEQMDNFKKQAETGVKEGDIWSDSSLNSFTKDVECTLRDYDAAILAQVTVDKFRSPPQKFLNGFIRFCATKIPLLPVDLGSHKPRKNFAEFTGSLAAIAAKEKSWTHRLIDENKFLRERLVKTVKNVDETGWDVKTYSESTIRRAELIFVNATFGFMLICPIAALSFIDSAVGRLCTVLGFLILGAILTSGIVTTANNSGLAVLAGYGAILIFFLGAK